MSEYTISDNPKLTLEGVSWAAYRTGLLIKEWRMGLDAGYVKMNQQQEINMITHGHRDHVKEINNIALENFKTSIFCPNKATEYVRKFIVSSYELNQCSDISDKDVKKMSEMFDIIGVNADETIDLPKFKGGIRIKTFKCYHYPETVGYGFSQIKKRSRSNEDIIDEIDKKLMELKNKDEIVLLEEIKREFQENSIKSKNYRIMKRFGIDFTEIYYNDLFCFLGDTNIRVFDNKDIFNYPVIIVECTFFENSEESIKEAKDRNHIHWNDLKPIVIDHPKVRFRLIHFSRRYSETEIKDFFDTQNIDNISVHI